jgi:hypothetical protein
MRLFLVAAIPLCLIVGDARSQDASRGAVTPTLRGVVRESLTARPLGGVAVHVVSVEQPSWSRTAMTNDAGRFEVRLERRGEFRLSSRRPGYTPAELSVRIASDTTSVSMELSPVATPLPEVAVREREIDLFVRDLRRAYRSVNRARVFDASQMDRTGQLLTGPFILGQAGVVPVSCGRSKQFLPEGKVRTQPVEREPADIWWPCFLDKGKPRSILIRIDGGPAEPFDHISNRALSEFAAIAVVGGGIVVAYTRDYATRVRGRRQASRR